MAKRVGIPFNPQDHAEFAAGEVVESARVGRLDNFYIGAECGKCGMQPRPNVLKCRLVAFLVLFFARLEGKPIGRISLCRDGDGAFSGWRTAGGPYSHSEFCDGETLARQTRERRLFQARVHEIRALTLYRFQQFFCLEWRAVESYQLSVGVPDGEVADDGFSRDDSLAAEQIDANGVLTILIVGETQHRTI